MRVFVSTFRLSAIAIILFANTNLIAAAAEKSLELDSFLAEPSGKDIRFSKPKIIEKDGIHLRVPVLRKYEFSALPQGDENELTRLTMANRSDGITLVALIKSVEETQSPESVVAAVAKAYGKPEAIKQDAEDSLYFWIGDREKISLSDGARIDVSEADRVLGMVGAVVRFGLGNSRRAAEKRVVEMPGAAALNGKAVVLSLSIIGPKASQDVSVPRAWFDAFIAANAKPVSEKEKAQAVYVKGRADALKGRELLDATSFFTSPFVDKSYVFGKPVAAKVGDRSTSLPCPEGYSVEKESPTPFVIVAAMTGPDGELLVVGASSTKALGKTFGMDMRARSLFLDKKKEYGTGEVVVAALDGMLDSYRQQGFRIEADLRHELVQNTEENYVGYNFFLVSQPDAEPGTGAPFHHFNGALLTRDEDMLEFTAYVVSDSETEAKRICLTWINEFVELNR